MTRLVLSWRRSCKWKLPGAISALLLKRGAGGAFSCCTRCAFDLDADSEYTHVDHSEQETATLLVMVWYGCPWLVDSQEISTVAYPGEVNVVKSSRTWCTFPVALKFSVCSVGLFPHELSSLTPQRLWKPKPHEEPPAPCRVSPVPLRVRLEPSKEWGA